MDGATGRRRVRRSTTANAPPEPGWGRHWGGGLARATFQVALALTSIMAFPPPVSSLGAAHPGEATITHIPTPCAPGSDAEAEVAFLSAVRTFLTTALTPDLREAGRGTIGVYSEIGAARVWHQRLYGRGWIAPSWPTAFGGAGWTARQRYLFERECAMNDAPVLFAAGLRSLGPLLIELGSPAQQARYLPAMLDGSDLWCQGFSEPGAGSDLAALTTRATRSGDGYLVNGSKIWTTGAHLANRMFALVRTMDAGRRQNGLTFLLIDMDSPGLSVAPILGLSGEHEFNQVFFTDVRVPEANRVGLENDGWSVAKRLMQLARSNNTPAALVRRTLRRTEVALQEAPSPLEPAIRARLAGLAIQLEAFEQLEMAALPTGGAVSGDPKLSSSLKLLGTELHQKVCELALEIAGPQGQAAMSVFGHAGPAMDRGARVMAKHLAVRAATIYSGASETQRNIIARQLLDV